MECLQNNTESTIYREFSPSSFPWAGKEGEKKIFIREGKESTIAHTKGFYSS